jgi:hypothetical protein
MQYAFAATAVATGLTLIKGLLDLRAEENKAKARAAPTVSCLSQVKDNFHR